MDVWGDLWGIMQSELQQRLKEYLVEDYVDEEEDKKASAEAGGEEVTKSRAAMCESSVGRCANLKYSRLIGLLVFARPRKHLELKPAAGEAAAREAAQ